MNELNINLSHKVKVNGVDLQLFSSNEYNDFFSSNKKTTIDYRAALAQAIGTTGKVAKITHMEFGTGGSIDSQGNPLPPSDNGALNNAVLKKAIKKVLYPTATTVCFEAEIEPGELTAAINEVALIDESGKTAAKMRMLTAKGTDAESGLAFEWNVEF